MARKSSSSSVVIAQVVAVVGLILAGYFVVGFARVTLAGYRARALKARLEADVADLEGIVAGLQQRLDYVQTDEYVEEVARQELKMARPGDHPVVPLFRGEAVGVAPEGTPSAGSGHHAMPPWRAWWALFFDR